MNGVTFTVHVAGEIALLLPLSSLEFTVLSLSLPDPRIACATVDSLPPPWLQMRVAATTTPSSWRESPWDPTVCVRLLGTVTLLTGLLCQVFDNYRPSPPLQTVDEMQEPVLSSNYPFTNMRSPWLSTAGDDMTLAAPSDDMSNWNDFMRSTWNESAPQGSQSVETKPVTALHGPAASFLKPGNQPPLPFTHRPHPPPQSQSIAPSSIPISASMYSQSNDVPFTFGQSIDVSPAFDFNGNALSSPQDVEVQQQNGFYSPPMWQQQQQVADNNFYAASRSTNPSRTMRPASDPTMSLPIIALVRRPLTIGGPVATWRAPPANGGYACA